MVWEPAQHGKLVNRKTSRDPHFIPFVFHAHEDSPLQGRERKIGSISKTVDVKGQAKLQNARTYWVLHCINQSLGSQRHAWQIIAACCMHDPLILLTQKHRLMQRKATCKRKVCGGGQDA